MSDEHMPSHVPSLHFTVCIDGTWRLADGPPPQHHAPASLARDHLREQAARILKRHNVLEIPAAEDAVNAVIARPLSPEPGIIVHGTVRLTVSDTDVTLAEEHLRRTRQDAFGRLDADYDNAGVRSPDVETADADGAEFDRVRSFERVGGPAGQKVTSLHMK
ncbi:hypothetical protein [Streptomyces mayteni]